MKRLIASVWMGIFLCSGIAMAAGAQAGGLVPQVQGKVVIAGKDGKATPVPAFMKLAQGDRLSVASGGKLQIVYLGGGRQETWSEAAQIEIGATESKAIQAGAPPVVKNLPPFVVQTLTSGPGVMASVQSRQGMIRMRAVPLDPAAVAAEKQEARSQYDELRKAAAADDITPEIYLLTVLQKLGAHDDIRGVLAEMLKRQPNNAEAKALADHYGKMQPNS